MVTNIDVVDVFPTPTYASGQIAFSYTSGVLGITNSGVWWLANMSGPIVELPPESGNPPPSGSSGIFPDDPLVSGSLRFWGHPSGIEVAAGGGSGIAFWNNRSVYISPETFKPAGSVNPPKVASGQAYAGQDRVHFVSVNDNHFIEDDFAGLINGSDKPFTVFVVGQIQPTGAGNYTAWCCAMSNTIIGFTQIYAGGVVDSAAMGARKRDHGAGGPSNDTGHMNVVPSGLDSAKHVWVWLCSGVNIRMFRDNIEMTSAPSGFNVTNMSSNNGRIGCVKRVDGLISEWNGFMDEIVVYEPSGLPTEHVDLITQNLAFRHGITIESGMYT